jgi:hypothetical protein
MSERPIFPRSTQSRRWSRIYRTIRKWWLRTFQTLRSLLRLSPSPSKQRTRRTSASRNWKTCLLRPTACSLRPTACSLRPTACSLRPTACSLKGSARTQTRRRSQSTLTGRMSGRATIHSFKHSGRCAHDERPAEGVLDSGRRILPDRNGDAGRTAVGICEGEGELLRGSPQGATSIPTPGAHKGRRITTKTT